MSVTLKSVNSMVFRKSTDADPLTIPTAVTEIVKKDPALRNFYQRIRKRSSAKIARVAVARKLAAICWVRLMAWHRAHAT
jgi:hypothetical protein